MPRDIIIGALARIVASLEEGVDRIRYGREPAGRLEPRIAPYRGFGSADAVWVTGRVLRNPPLPPTLDDAHVLENLVATFRRFETDEVPHARVRLRLGGVERDVVANGEGFFEATLEPAERLPMDRTWHEVEAELLSPASAARATATLPVLVPPATASLGIVSDIDDTVIRTGAHDILGMARGLLFGNARTRLPFEGVAAFYRALVRGRAGGTANPIFYVSSSPWNLYELLVEAFAHLGIPAGPLLLRDWGITSSELLPLGHGAHKLEAIRRILTRYPSLPFVLIGDSGQEDPEIYAAAMREAPGRVLAAYIRNVSGERPMRADAIRDLAREVEADGGTLLLVDDTIAAARHAAAQGWIPEEALAEVGAGVARDD